MSAFAFYFGPSLCARAALDGYCRLAGICFLEAMRRNLVGVGRLVELFDLSGKHALITRSINHPVPPMEMSSR
ncbi:hypothetical protein EHI43_30255 [Rhizobium leguminosarum]|nr:hypothetical protein EHI43_30255 [Rhizobium leguminosarum]